MQLLKELLDSSPDGEVIDVRVGLHWTVVVVQVGGETRCGLASSMFAGHEHDDHKRHPAVPESGQLETYSAKMLAEWVTLDKPTQASIGMAALNALLPRDPKTWVDANAEEMISRWGMDKHVAMIGHFPFTERLRPHVGELFVLEKHPKAGDLPAESAAQILPDADVVAITGMALVNHSLEGLLELCSPDSVVILLGPSTPLSPILFEYGVDVISGSIVTEIEPVLKTISQGGNFRQVHCAGVRLVNIVRSGLM